MPSYPPEYFAHWPDRMKERFPELQKVFGPSCIWRGGVPTEQCFRMEEARRWRGLWRNEFEGSRFCEAPAAQCDHDTPSTKMWLTNKLYKESYGGLYQVDFIGRRTLYPGLFGHLPITDRHEVIVDRMLVMKEVEAPPPPPTEAEIIANWKACQAAKSCWPSPAMSELIKRSE